MAKRTLRRGRGLGGRAEFHDLCMTSGTFAMKRLHIIYIHGRVADLDLGNFREQFRCLTGSGVATTARRRIGGGRIFRKQLFRQSRRTVRWKCSLPERVFSNFSRWLCSMMTLYTRYWAVARLIIILCKMVRVIKGDGSKLGVIELDNIGDRRCLRCLRRTLKNGRAIKNGQSRHSKNGDTYDQDDRSFHLISSRSRLSGDY